MLRFRLKQALLVGISIQPKNIHLIQLKKTKNSYLLARANRVSLPENVFVNGKINAFDDLLMVLQKLVREEQLNDLQAAVCIPVHQVKMQRMMIPAALTDDEVETEVRRELGRSQKTKKDMISVDFQRSSAVSTQDIPLIYAAASRDYVERYAEVLRQAGLAPAIMDVDVFALLRAARHALRYTISDSDKLAVLYFGHDYAVMVSVHGSEIKFHAEWQEGSKLVPVMNVMQWVKWCAHAYSETGVTNLAIAGEESEIREAAQIFADNWACRIYEIDPFAQMTRCPDVDRTLTSLYRSSFMLACGLAMREPLPWLK